MGLGGRRSGVWRRGLRRGLEVMGFEGEPGRGGRRFPASSARLGIDPNQP